MALYFKDGEQISQLLNLLGGHNAVLSLENVRVVKGIATRSTGWVNCETANMDKTLEAAYRQAENIKLIEENGLVPITVSRPKGSGQSPASVSLCQSEGTG